MASLSVLTWIKLVLRLTMTQTFGPMFKIILILLTNLAFLLSLWFLVLISLTSVSSILFADLPEYQSFGSAMYMHFEFALGNFDSSIFCQGD
jgi:hypothetical protein